MSMGVRLVRRLLGELRRIAERMIFLQTEPRKYVVRQRKGGLDELCRALCKAIPELYFQLMFSCHLNIKLK